MYKILLSLTLFIFISSQFQINGQKRTYSPASRYGIGEIKRGGYGQSAGMGQTGIALGSSSYLNNLNPASYSSMDSLSFYFEGGIRGFYQVFEDDNTSGQNSNIVFDYFAMGFALSKKAHASIGLNTFSETGYDMQTELKSDTTYGTATNIYQGNGSINKVYLGLSMSPAKNLKVGVHASYLFGNLKNLSAIEFMPAGTTNAYGTLKETHISDVCFDFGAQYQIDLNATSHITLGAVFTPAQKINNRYSNLIAEKIEIVDENTITLQVDTLEHTEFEEPDFSIPFSYGFGVSYQLDDVLTLAFDYKYENWANSTTPDPTIKLDNGSTVDMRRFSGGCEYTPNNRSANNYLKRIRYRLGGYYLNDYISVKGHQVEDIGMSFGLGFPLKRSKSSVNIACELGKKNFVTESNYKESYIKLLVNVSLHEFWFVKQKFD